MGKESGFNRLCLKVILAGSQSLRLDRERSQGQERSLCIFSSSPLLLELKQLLGGLHFDLQLLKASLDCSGYIDRPDSLEQEGFLLLFFSSVNQIPKESAHRLVDQALFELTRCECIHVPCPTFPFAVQQ